MNGLLLLSALTLSTTVNGYVADAVSGLERNGLKEENQRKVVGFVGGPSKPAIARENAINVSHHLREVRIKLRCTATKHTGCGFL
jgi:hypothetical protein